MTEPIALLTSLVIMATSLFSYFGFTHREIEQKYIFHSESILAGKQYYRLVTSAFLHANWSHLIWNMLSLYLFGRYVELVYGPTDFLLIYFGAVLGGSLLSLYLHRHHEYMAYGASGGACGVIFAHVLLFQGAGVYLYFIPIAIPGWLYAIGFMVGSFFALKAGRDNVGHDAHLGGAIIGLLIAAGLHPQVATQNWKLFTAVLVVSLVIAVYLWKNPLFLSLGSFPISSWFRRNRSVWRGQESNLPGYMVEQIKLDQTLEKLSRHGIQSLTHEEKALLEQVSGKYRRRAESKKPDSGLAI